jgi:hypothetical protein
MGLNYLYSKSLTNEMPKDNLNLYLVFDILNQEIPKEIMPYLQDDCGFFPKSLSPPSIGINEVFLFFEFVFKKVFSVQLSN